MERYIFTEENRRLMKYRWMWRHGTKGIFGLYGPVGSGKTLFLEGCFEDREPCWLPAADLYREIAESGGSGRGCFSERSLYHGEDCIIIPDLDLILPQQIGAASGGALEEQIRKADEVYEKLFRWAKICAEEGKLVIFTEVSRSCYRLAGEELTAVEVFPAPVNTFTVNCLCSDCGFWPEQEDYRMLLKKETLLEAEQEMAFLKLTGWPQTEPRQKFPRLLPSDADQRMYLLFSPYLTYELTWREASPEECSDGMEGDEPEQSAKDDVADPEGDEPEQSAKVGAPDPEEDEAEEDAAVPVYVRTSEVPEELREDYRNFFSGDSLIEAKMVWGKQIMPGLYRQTGFQKMLDELQTLQKKRRDSASRTFFRLLVSCAAEVERRDDEIPAVEPLFLSCGLSEGEKGKLPEKIRCYLLENGEKAILVPEREFSENAWMF